MFYFTITIYTQPPRSQYKLLVLRLYATHTQCRRCPKRGGGEARLPHPTCTLLSRTCALHNAPCRPSKERVWGGGAARMHSARARGGGEGGWVAHRRGTTTSRVPSDGSHRSPNNVGSSPSPPRRRCQHPDRIPWPVISLLVPWTDSRQCRFLNFFIALFLPSSARACHLLRGVTWICRAGGEVA